MEEIETIQQEVQETVQEKEIVAPIKKKATKKVSGTKVPGTGTKVPGMKVEVGGIAVHSVNGEVEYSVKIELPRQEDWQMYLKEAAELALRKESLAYVGVLSYPVDDEEECEVEASFIGKDPRDLTRDELFAAKCYYGLRGIKCAEDLRTARMGVYKQLCMALERPAPKNEMIKAWPELICRRVLTPAGDTLTKQTQPIKFIPDGDNWIKKVVIE